MTTLPDSSSTFEQQSKDPRTESSYETDIAINVVNGACISPGRPSIKCRFSPKSNNWQGHHFIVCMTFTLLSTFLRVEAHTWWGWSGKFRCLFPSLSTIKRYFLFDVETMYKPDQ